MEPLALAAELARYDIVFTTYTALTVQERLAASCCTVWGALYPPHQQFLQASHAVFAQIQWRRIVLDECQEVQLSHCT